MNLSVNIQIPYLWGNQAFQKNEWGSLNFLVGPNGTGKTQFAERLKQQCQNQGLTTRYLNAERLTGFEKQDYGLFGYSQMGRGLDIGQFSSYKNQGKDYGLSSGAFVILKEKLDVRIRVEASLSQLFGRRIRLAEEGGFLKPKVQKIRGGDEYGMKESECHGLKELITLLTFIYDDEYNCLIIDEPELHLHPQFQTLFLQEIRNIAGDPRTDPRKKCFFLITHSPYYVDIRTPNDLKHCIVFQPEKLPTYVNQLEGDDEWKIKRLLPRLNTHHKQFFFASRPIFVEGYTDQQVFTLIQEKRGKLLGAAGVCIIDVGGKDELDLFFRLCKKLNIDAQFITDLDTFVWGKLRQSVSQDTRCTDYLQEEGLGLDLMTPIGEVLRAIDDCLSEIEHAPGSATSANSLLQVFRNALTSSNDIDKKRYIFLVGLKLIREQLESLIPNKIEEMNLIDGKLRKIIEAFKRCGGFLLPKGALENYLPSYSRNAYIIPDNVKTEVFEQERDFILNNELNEEQVCSRYGELIAILDKASRSSVVNMDEQLSYTISDWIHKVQMAFRRGEIQDAESLKRNAMAEWAIHSRIIELLEFSPNLDGFTSRIKLKPLVDSMEREVRFNNATVAASFKLEVESIQANPS